MPKVSIITPAHVDTEQKMVWFVEAIQSVLDQTEPDWEMVVVNNCSTEDQKVLKLLSPVWNDPRIKKHRLMDELNVSKARNLAAENATSELLLPLDADDKLRRDAVEMFLKAWELDGKDQGIVYSDVLIFGNNGHRYEKVQDYSFLSLLRRLTMVVGSLHRKSDWKRVGGWLESMSSGLEDWEYWIRMGKNGVCGYHVNADLYHYRRHATSRLTELHRESRKRFNEAQLKIRELHKDVYNGRFPMGCCPGGTVHSRRVGVQQQQVVQQERLVNPRMIRYVGMRKGSFYVTGRSTGIRYLVPGKGNLLVSSFGSVGVDGKDVEYILSLNRGRDFVQENVS